MFVFSKQRDQPSSINIYQVYNATENELSARDARRAPCAVSLIVTQASQVRRDSSEINSYHAH